VKGTVPVSFRQEEGRWFFVVALLSSPEASNRQSNSFRLFSRNASVVALGLQHTPSIRQFSSAINQAQ
jgi:hypothetical protein